MKGLHIREVRYIPIAHRTMTCVLLLDNGYEVTGSYCLDGDDLIFENNGKQKAYKRAKDEYHKLVNATTRQAIFMKWGDPIGAKESV